MKWGNPIFNISLLLHYLNGGAIGQMQNFNTNSNKKFQDNNSKSNFYKNYTQKEYSNNSHYNNCANNNTSFLCYSNWYSQQGNQAYPTQIPSANHGGQFHKTYYRNYLHHYNNLKTNPVLQYQPVYTYADPLKSRIDEAQGKEKGSHHQEPHGIQTSHEMSHGGWGWSAMHEPEHHHHHEKKKHKKGKKGVLGKLLKKIKPKHKKEKLIWKEVPECDGFENFIKDLEILGWLLGLVGFGLATIGLLLHFLNQVYLTFSVLIVGLPERIIQVIEIIAPMTVPEMLRQFFEYLALFDYSINSTFSYPLGNFIVVIETIAEILTIASLVLATITIFDDIIEEKVWTIFGIDLREALEGYGCDNPFSKEKKIEQFFEKFNKW